MKTRVSLKYFMNDFLQKHSFPCNLPQTPSKLISLRLLVARKPFTQFEPKIRVIKLQKRASICLTW